jgi:hypothetical protein
MFGKDVVKSYDALLKKQQKLMDAMSNLGREKDYKVQKIEKKYTSKIDNYIRQQEAVALRVELAKRYVGTTDYEKADIITKTKKEKL